MYVYMWVYLKNISHFYAQIGLIVWKNKSNSYIKRI